MKKTDFQQVLFISAILFTLFMIMPASAGSSIPDDVGSSNPYFIMVSNEGGASADIYGNDTYAMYFYGNNHGLTFEADNSYDPEDKTGENLLLNTSDGSFYLNFYGGKGGVQRVILMLAVNGSVQEDFSAHFTATGYNVCYDNETLFGSLSNHTSSDIHYEKGVSEYFDRGDFIYDSQGTRPPGETAIYHDQDLNNTENFQVMFIDTGLGIVGNRISKYGNIENPDLTDTGKLKIDYHFENLGDCLAVIDAYGWIYSGSDSTDSLNPSISWTNLKSTDGEVKILIEDETPIEAPVASFEAGSTWGEAPFTVQFTDTSTDYPTSWKWDFGDGTNSTASNPSHTYENVGTYSVNLTVANSGGSDTMTIPDYITVAAAGSSLLADSPWPEFGFDSQNTRLSPYNGPQTAVLKWSSSLSSIKYSSPSIDSNGNIYIGTSGDNSMYAVYPDGTHKWKFTTGNEVHGTAAISSDGTIYFGSYDGNLYALNPDGTEKWHYNNGGENLASPVIGSDGTIYFTSQDYNLYAINPDGTLKWKYATSNKIYGSPAVASDGTVYTGSKDGYLHAINPDDGSLKWKFDATCGGSYLIYSTPAIASDGTVYIGNMDGNSMWHPGHIYAINPENGDLKWEYVTDTGIDLSSPAIGKNGTLYFQVYGACKLIALDSDGNLKWEHYVKGSSCLNSPAIDMDGTIYWAATYKNRLYALNPDDGSVIWSYSTPNCLYDSPAIGSDGTLYVGCYDGHLYAFENVVDFTSVKTSGASPLKIQFTGTSSRNVSSWSWDFGDGSTSTEQNPLHTFSSEGSYTVNLTITDDGTGETFTESKPDYIKVYTAPEANFSTNVTSGNVPMTVNFTDESMNSPTSWLWDFGDGNTSTEQNPVYTYLSEGTYPVTLYAENPAGSDTLEKSNYITVGAQPLPVVDFNSSVTNGQTPLEVTFTDLSSNTPLLSWKWDFGDGENSTEQNPTHTYDVYGNYTVELTATNYGGSNSTLKTYYITVEPQDPAVVSFDANTTLGLPPLSVAFTDKSTGYNITGWYWDFDDGTNSTEQNPVHNFESGGDYYVSLNVINDGGSNTSVILSPIVVKNMIVPVANFTANSTYGRYPTIQFTDESTFEPTSWEWDFGDGTISTDQNPVHTYSETGNYTVTLTATNAAGSSINTKTDYIECSYTNAKPLEDYQLINVYVSNDEGPKYAYASDRYVPGTYFLVFDSYKGGFNAIDMETTLGSINEYNKVTTNQTGKFWITFAGGRNSMDDGVLMVAVNGTIPDDFSVHIRSSGYNWSIGNVSKDDYVEGAIDQTFTRDDFLYGPQNWRPTSIENYQVTDRVVSADDTFEFMFIDLRAGLLKPMYHGHGYANLKDRGGIKVEYSFSNLTSVAVFNAYAWDHHTNHGIGIPMTSANPINIVVDGTVDLPVAGFTVSNMAGKTLEPVQFTDTSTGRPYSWLWEFGDGTNSTEQNPEHTYTDPGNYIVNLTATNYLGNNTKSMEITQVSANLPDPGFVADATSGVSPFEVTFTDTSTNSPISWFWDFGDGMTSTRQNPVHWYAPGIYTVNLTVANSGGNITHTEKDYIVVTGNSSADRIINPNFETGDTTGWELGSYASISTNQKHNGTYGIRFDTGGLSWEGYSSEHSVTQHVDLTNVLSISFWGCHDVSSYTQYFKTYVDGILVRDDTCSNTWTEYTILTGNYTGVHEIRITFDKNCYAGRGYIDDLSIVNESKTPITRFAATSSTYGEYPLTVQFTDASSNYPTEWEWDFNGDGGVDSIEQSPVYTYNNVGNYSVTLTAANGKGTDSALKTNYITVKGLQKTSSNVLIKNNGTLTDNGNGKKQYKVNQSEVKVEGNDIVINSGSYTIKIKSDKTPETNGSSFVSEVTGIELETDPVEAFLDELGDVSGSVNLTLNDLPENSALEITLEKGESGKGTAFQLAADASGLDVNSVAYTMDIVKTNLTNRQEIKEARITMSVPVSWVNANGGTSVIKIIRIAEDGTKEVLDTTYTGRDGDLMTFEGYSPNGLSLFGLASVTEQKRPLPGTSTSTSSGGSGGGKSDLGISSLEDVPAGDMTELKFDKTGITGIDLYAKENIEKILITTENRKMPEGAGTPEGEIYEYVKVLAYHAPESSIEKVRFRFEVPRDWVDKRLSSPDMISLYQYNEETGQWLLLSTVFENEVNGFYEYFAESASIGSVAIAALPDISAESTPVSDSDPVQSYSEELLVPDEADPTATADPTAKPVPLFGGVTILFAVFAVFCVIAVADRRSGR